MANCDCGATDCPYCFEERERPSASAGQGQVGKVPESESPPGDALREFREAFAENSENAAISCVGRLDNTKWGRFIRACERLATTPEPGSPLAQQERAMCPDCVASYPPGSPGSRGRLASPSNGEQPKPCERCGKDTYGRLLTPAEPGSPGDVLVEALVKALEEGMVVADSHYAHFDREGTAGANCPACRARSEWRERARAALAKHPEKP